MARPTPLPLADQDLSDIFIWCLVLLGLVVVLFVVASLIRRWSRKVEDMPRGGFTLADLRQLHREGKMTNAEFELARARILESHKAAEPGPKPPLAARGAAPDQQPPEGADNTPA